MLSSQNVLDRGVIDFSNPSRYLSEADFEVENRRTDARPGDVLLTIVGSIGRSAVVPSDAAPFALQRSVAVIRTEEQDPHFLSLQLQTSGAKAYYDEYAKGTAQRGIYLRRLAKLPIVLPPIDFQRRAVARFNEAMTLCDELEAAQQEREARRDRLVSATLHRLTNGASDDGADDGAGFNETGRFFINHLPEMTARIEHVDEIRLTILSLSLRGRLVPQNSDEEPLAINGMPKEKMSTDMSNEAEFLLPGSWRWVTVGEVAECRLGKMLDSAKNRGHPRPYLRNVNVRWFDFDMSDIFQMKIEDAEVQALELRNGDVLVCEGGEPGRAAIWDGRVTPMYFQKAIHRVRLAEGISPKFFARSLYHDARTGRLSRFFTGVTIKHLTGRGLSRYSFPLPPPAEQRRIDRIVDRLMLLCDQLESAILTGRDTRSRLLDSTLHQALAEVG